MKRASAIISIVIIVVVLLGALGVGLCIREIKSRRAETESEAATELDTQQMQRTGQASPEERAKLKDQREAMRQRWENMSDEERQRMRERFQKMSDEERKQMRQRLQSSGEESRQQGQEKNQ